MRGRFLPSALAIATLLGSVGCGREDPPPAPQQAAITEGTIVAVGNSLTAGLGVAEELAYPAQLERKLAAAGLPYRVINAGVSGETSSGALSRIHWILRLKPDIVILETGANDGLRGTDPSLTRKNIEDILRVLQGAQVSVVVAGMQMVANLGPEYTEAFRQIYPEAAKAFRVPLIPFFLAGVAGHSALNQADGIHPTADGYRIVTETVYPYVVQAIREREKSRGP
jgi:acyl-CoA thioesterase I